MIGRRTEERRPSVKHSETMHKCGECHGPFGSCQCVSDQPGEVRVGDTMIVFNNDEWSASGDISNCDQPAEILELGHDPDNGHQCATVRFPDGSISYGRLIRGMSHPEKSYPAESRPAAPTASPDPSNAPEQYGPFEIAARSPEGTNLTLFICPLCAAAVPSGLGDFHQQWHKRVNNKAAFGLGTTV